MQSFRSVFVFAFILGLSLRFYFAAQPLGSEDLITWGEFAKSFARTFFSGGEISVLYQNYNRLNHPLPAVMIVGSLFQISEIFSFDFNCLFRIFVSLFDCLTALALHQIVLLISDRRSANIAFTAWLISPIAIMISGFHGNTDSLYICLIAFALLALLRDQARLAALLFGFSTSIKVLPLLLFPSLIIYFYRSRDSRKVLLYLLIGMLPCLSGLTLGPTYLKQVYLYHPTPNFYWGINGFLQLVSESKAISSPLSLNLNYLYQLFSSCLVIGAAITVPYVMRTREKSEIVKILAVSYIVSLILSPGIGVQYLALAGFLILAVSWKDGVFFSLMFSLYAYTCYHPNVFSRFSDGRLQSYAPTKLGVFLGFAIVAALIEFLIRQVSKERKVLSKLC